MLGSDIREWCTDRWWQWRAALLAVLAWDVRGQLTDPDRGSLLFGGIIFGSHEFGHLLFVFFGQFLMVLGGSLTQLLVPLGAALLLLRQRDYFGIAVVGCWLSASLIDLARYIGDARALELDLVGFGDDPQHDWAYLLGHFHALPWDTRLAGGTRAVGVLLLGASLVFGAWLCLEMRRRPSPGS